MNARLRRNDTGFRANPTGSAERQDKTQRHWIADRTIPERGDLEDFNAFAGD